MKPGRRALGTIVAASVACVAAMFRYPGGTSLDRATQRYSITHNFLSDLGMTVAYNGQPNRLGAALFIVALMSLVIGGTVSLLPIMRAIAVVPSARPWMRAVGVCLLVAGVAFTGVAFTPENRAMQLHVDFTLWGWRVVAALSLLLGVAATRAGERHRRAALVALATGGALVVYTATFIWGPRCCGTDGSLMFHVVMQKCAAIVVSAALLGLATGDA